MVDQVNFKNKLFNRRFFQSDTGLQDVIFLVGIFLFISILIIGLFPGKSAGMVIDREFFIYAVMTVPAIAAIYFIIISFRRKLNSDTPLISSSIRKKIALAFVFVAIVPNLPVVIISYNVLNRTMSNLIFDKTNAALNEAVTMSREPVADMGDRIYDELADLQFTMEQGGFSVLNRRGRDIVRKKAGIKGLSVAFFNLYPSGGSAAVVPTDDNPSDFPGGFRDFYSVIDTGGDVRIDRITISDRKYLAGSFRAGPVLTVLYDVIPEKVFARQELYAGSLEDYHRLEYLLKTFFRGRVGLFLLGLSIFSVSISILVSLYLSKNITRPVLNLSGAAREIAAGNFNLRIRHDSEDEMGILYRSFNQMVSELDRNRRAMYQKQRLEAWRDMARRVVHEVKNPLTPIRLSAERMRKQYLNKNPRIDEIILSGTETIVEEVEVLMGILGEFTRFARLPEMKPVRADVNELLEGCVNIFSAHEGITFTLSMDSSMPDLFIDKVLMKQTFTNLIQNAVDAVEMKGRIEIVSKHIPENDRAVIRIADNGTGIRKENMDKVFDPGFSTKPSGTGLGLAIVEKIVMEHRGSISCQSEYRQGTEIIIELPVTAGEENAHGKDTDS